MTRRRRPVGLLESGNGTEDVPEVSDMLNIVGTLEQDSDIIDVELIDSGDVQPSPKVRRPPIMPKGARPLDFNSPPHSIETVDITQEVIIPLHTGRHLRETLVPVACPLYPAVEPSPENPGGSKPLIVWFKVNSSISTFGGIQNVLKDPELLNDPLPLLTRIRKVARRFENWNILDDEGDPIPEPTPSVPETYRYLLEDEDLAMWLITDGYIAAVSKGQTKNSESDSTQ